jgi:hypothetical protein
VVCAPDASGTLIASPAESCTGVGDKINYAVAPALVDSTVTLTGVTITGTAPGTADAVAINPGATAQTVLATGGSITAVAGNGIAITATAGTGTLSVGTATNRVTTAISGGNGLLTAQGIFIAGRGDINVYTGAGAILGTSTGGGSWAIRVQNSLAGSNPGGAVMVNTQGLVSALRGGILATTVGTDITDTVTVVSTGAVTSVAGAAIQTSAVNGNTSITVSAPVNGSVGAGTGGISATATGGGNVAITTLAGGTVTGNGGANGIVVSSGAGGLALNIGANVNSTGASAIKTTNLVSVGTNTITIGAAAITGLGGSTAGVIDVQSLSGGLTTLTAGAGTSITSNAATAALQNGNLAVTSHGGAVVFNNGGLLRGTVDFSQTFSGVQSTNLVTVNNSSISGWHTTGVSVFTGGNDIVNNSGLIATNAPPRCRLSTARTSSTIWPAAPSSSRKRRVPPRPISPVSARSTMPVRCHWRTMKPTTSSSRGRRLMSAPARRNSSSTRSSAPAVSRRAQLRRDRLPIVSSSARPAAAAPPSSSITPAPPRRDG